MRSSTWARQVRTLPAPGTAQEACGQCGQRFSLPTLATGSTTTVFTWNRTTTGKEPLTGKMRQVKRPKEDWVAQQRPEMRIVSDQDRRAADQQWREIDGVFPSKKGKRGFEGKRRSYVGSHPTHLLSGSLKCGSCGGAKGLVSGKGSGYYGCLNASRKACDNT
jgi:hypothetical protein